MTREVEGGNVNWLHAHPAPRGRATRSTRPIGCDAARTGARCSARHPGPIARAIARGRRAATMCSTWATGTRRVIRPRTSPRPSRCGWRRARAGSAATPPGRRCASCVSCSNSPANSEPIGRRCAAATALNRCDLNQRTLAQYYRSKLARARTRRGLLADRLLRRVFTDRAGRAGAQRRGAAARAQGAAAGVADARHRRRALRGASDPAHRDRAQRAAAAVRARLAARTRCARRVPCCAGWCARIMRSQGLRLRA